MAAVLPAPRRRARQRSPGTRLAFDDMAVASPVVPYRPESVSDTLMDFLRVERAGTGVLWDGQSSYPGVVLPSTWNAERDPFPGFTVVVPGTRTTPLLGGVVWSKFGGVLRRAAELDPRLRHAGRLRAWIDAVGIEDDDDALQAWISRVKMARRR